MPTTREKGRWSVRPDLLERILLGGFMGVWVCGWISPLVFFTATALFTPQAPTEAVPSFSSDEGGEGGWLVVVLFGGMYLLGLVAGVYELLRSVIGEDSVELVGNEVRLVRRAGIFRRERKVKRASVQRVRLSSGRKKKWLGLETKEGWVPVTRFGSRSEREAWGAEVASLLRVRGP